MKKITLGFACACLLILGVAAMRNQNTGILITGGFGGEPKLKAVQADQTANWIEFDNFAVPASGIIGTNNGGTGTNTMGVTITNVVFTLGSGATVTNSIINGIVR